MAVVNTSVLPSGEMVRDVDVHAAGRRDPRARSSASRGPAPHVAVDARRLSEALFGDYMATNMLVLGVAYQSGLLPLTAAAIEEAVRLNGVAVDAEPPGVPLRPALGGRPGPGPGARRAAGAVVRDGASRARSSGSAAATRAPTCRSSTAARTSTPRRGGCSPTASAS